MKTKLLLIFALVISSVTIASAQQYQEVIHLKNGSVIKGIIVEQIPNKEYKVETADGSLFIFEWNDVSKITRERGVTAEVKTKKETQAIDAEPKFRYGVKAGMNVAMMVGDDMEDLSARIGCVVGFTSEYKINNTLSLGVDVLYSQQGSRYECVYEWISYSNYEYLNYNAAYINIPIVANVYILNDLAFKVGLQPGFLLSAKYKDYSYSDNFGSEYYSDIDIEPMCNTFDIAVPIGLSYNINNNMTIDARYNIGLTNVLRKSVSDNLYDTKIRNDVFQLTLGLRF